MFCRALGEAVTAVRAALYAHAALALALGDDAHRALPWLAAVRRAAEDVTALRGLAHAGADPAALARHAGLLAIGLEDGARLVAGILPAAPAPAGALGLAGRRAQGHTADAARHARTAGDAAALLALAEVEAEVARA